MIKKIYFGPKILYISDEAIDLLGINLPFEGPQSIEHAIVNLEKGSNAAVVLYGKPYGELWSEFTKMHKVLVAAGGAVVKEGNVLMILRNGYWDLPKGKVEKRETKEEAAIREVKEECGVKNLELGDFITETYHLYTLKGDLVVKHTYWYRMFTEQNEFYPQKEEGISEVRWVPFNELEEYKTHTYENIKIVLNEL